MFEPNKSENPKSECGLVLVSLTALSLLAVACGEVKVAKVPRVAGQSGELRGMERPFNPYDIVFTYSQVIVWRADVKSSDIAAALTASTAYDGVQDEIYSAMVARKAALKEVCEAIPAWEIGRVRKELATIEAKEPKEEADLKKIEELKARIAELEGQPCFNLSDYAKAEPELKAKQKDLEALKKQLEELKAQTPPNESLIKRTEAKIRQAEKQIKPLLESKAKLEAEGLADRVEPFQAIEVKLETKRAEGAAKLEIVKGAGSVLDASPMHFGFKRGEDLRMHAHIHNFDLSKFLSDASLAETDVPSEFSTENFTMGKVTYQELGEFYTFEVYTPKAAYYFKPARNKHDAPDGRIHFKGDIIRCSVEDGKIGRAVVKHTRDELRDIVGCDIDLSGWYDASGKLPEALQARASQPVLRRGIAILNDLDEKD